MKLLIYRGKTLIFLFQNQKSKIYGGSIYLRFPVAALSLYLIYISVSHNSQFLMSLSKSLYLILSQYLIFSKISLYLMSLSFSCISVFHVFQDIMYHNISRSHVFQQILYVIQSCIFSTSVISVSHLPHVYKYKMYTIYLCVT